MFPIRISLRGFAGLLLGLLPSLVHAQAPTPLSIPNLDLRAAGQVTAMTTAADGSSYVCGFFSQVNGVNRSRIARILSDGQLDANWNPGLDDFCLALSIVDNGQNLLVGIRGRAIGGQTRKGIALLPATAERVFGSGFE